MERSCRADNFGNFTLDAFFSDCAFLNGFGSEIILDGFFQQTAADAGLCSGTFAGSLPVTFRLTDFSAEQIDLDGTITDVSAGEFVDSFLPAGEGCAGPDGASVLDGDLFIEIFSFSDQGELLVETDLFATELAVAQTSSGSPCQVLLGIDGGLDVFNGLTGEEFSLGFSEFLILSARQADGSEQVTLRGGITTACLGDLQIDTVQSLVLATEDAFCPSAGILEVTLPDQSVSRVQYTARGVDFDGDGMPDASSCIDPSLAQCPGECVPCVADEDCPGTLECFECTEDCAPGAAERCAPVEFAAVCDDGTF
ncbi:MAG: hypothetical protein ACE5I7_16195 [Candidatus Binatia bacterium]